MWSDTNPAVEVVLDVEYDLRLDIEKIEFTLSDTATGVKSLWNNETIEVNGEATLDRRIKVTGDVTLDLKEGSKPNANMGINVPVGSSLTIQGSGELVARITNGYDLAGIGGNDGQSAGTITITGGTIEARGGDNAAGIGGGYGGSGGTVNISGGTVKAAGGNSAGIGGGIDGNGGAVTISGGTVIATGGSCGIGRGAFNDDAVHGTLTLGEGVCLYGGDTENTTTVIPLENNDYVRNRYMAVYGPASHTHEFTYSADGATITATCTADGCTDPAASATLTIVAPTLGTYGEEADPAAGLENTSEFNGVTGLKVSEADVRYVGRDGTSYDESDKAPAEAGRYTAKITLDGVTTAEGEGGSVTASVDYEIAQAETQVTAAPAASAITYGQTLAQSTLSGGAASVEGTFAWAAADTAPSVADSGRTEYDVTFTPASANFAPASCKVTLTVNRAPSSVTKAPAAKSLTYSGKAQALVTVGKASGGEMQYSLDGKSWSAKVPTATNAGSYTVRYRVAGDENHTDAAAKSVKSTIAKARLTSIAKVADQAWTGKAVTPKPAVKGGSKALKAGTDFTYGYKGNAKAGTATVTATGKGNYTGTVKTTFKIVAATTTGRAHLQGSGWQPTKSDPDLYGTTGKSLRMEALSLSLPKGFPVKGSIQYRSHLQGKGWETSWKKDGATSGTIGESRRIEAVQIKLTGDAAKKYDVYYRVHAQNLGWMGWARNGAKAGTEGMSKRAEAVQVVLVPKGGKAPGATYRGQAQGFAKAFVS